MSSEFSTATVPVSSAFSSPILLVPSLSSVTTLFTTVTATAATATESVSATNTPTSTASLSDLPYGYDPTGWIAIVFLALFAISTLLHIGQSVRYRSWWLVPTVILGTSFEVAGWTARYMSSRSPELLGPFRLQLLTLTIAPVLIIGANFVTFSKMVDRLGRSYSRFTPTWYSATFLSTGFLSLLIQTVGAAIVGNGGSSAKNVITAGLVLFLLTVAMFSISVVEYTVRYTRESPFATAKRFDRGVLSPKLRILAYAITLTTGLHIARAIYRAIDLSNATGWSDETVFSVLDGALMLLATLTLNLAHPGYLLQKDYIPVHPEKDDTFDASDWV